MLNIKLLSLLGFFLIAPLIGCHSDGGTSTGLGLGIGGGWSGALLRNNTTVANFSMSLSQSADDPIDPFSTYTLSGVLTTSNSCIGDGEVSGTLSGNTISLQVDTGSGTLNLAGVVRNIEMSGSWSNSASSTETETTTTPAATCSFGGSWFAAR